MARFITAFDTLTIDLDQITCIHFDPELMDVLTIYTSSPKMPPLIYRNNALDRRAIRDLISGIRSHCSIKEGSSKQPERFYRMLSTIDRWLNAEDDKNGT